MQPTAPPVVPATATIGRAHTIPWLIAPTVALSLMPLGLFLHSLWGDSPAVPSVILTITVIALTRLTWRAGTPRGVQLRGHATVSVGTAGTWLIAAVITGPTEHPVSDGWWLILFSFTASWWLHRWLRRGDGGGPAASSGWEDVGAAVGLARSRVLSTRVDGPRVHATVELARGFQTAADVTGSVLRKTAAYLGLPGGAVTTAEDPAHAGVAHMTMVTLDLLINPIPWPGLSSPGGCITEPLLLGIRENGDPLQLILPAQPRLRIPAQNCLICGMTGAGKSVTGLILCAEVASRHNADLEIFDTVKGAQFLSPFVGRPRVTIYREDREADRAIEALPARIKQRADYLGNLGLRDWQPGCGINYVVIHVEEAAASAGKKAAFAKAAQQCRSAGMSLVTSQQRVTTANLSSDVRQQMGSIFQFGCNRESRPQDYGIGEAVINAGAIPHHWGNSKPGYCYAQVPGVDPGLWHQPGRIFDASPTEITAALTGHEPPTRTAGETPALEAKALFIARLNELHAEGRTVIRPADFDDVLAQIGKSRPWLSEALKAMVTQGKLTGGNGAYQFADALVTR